MEFSFSIYNIYLNLNSYKNGRVVLVLKGRFSGSKAIILSRNRKLHQNGVKSFLIAGIQKYPQNTSRKLKENKMEKKCRLKIFLKEINTNHVLPTRFFIDLSKIAKDVVEEKIEDYIEFVNNNRNNRKKIRKEKIVFTSFMRNVFLDQFFSGKQKWFFKKLKF